MDMDSTTITPEHTPVWEWQHQPDTCAVVSEMSIINQFGHDLTQEQAAFISAENGWYMPGGGTSPEHIGNMMDIYGIPNHTVMDATVADLARELQAGHGVIVGVNSDELWSQGALAELWEYIKSVFGFDNSLMSPADHAVVVTGIDMNDPSSPQVIINDSGTPDGASAHYPLDKFMDAWENSNCYYVATDSPMPGAQPDVLEQIDFSPWLTVAIDVLPELIGGAVAGGSMALGLDPLTSADIGIATISLLNDYFETPGAIEMI